jgi:hypothetical protein
MGQGARVVHAVMMIGELVIYEGRRYVVAGVTPFSVTPFRVLLEDPETKRKLWVEWPPEPLERAALRVDRAEPDAADGAATPPAASP